MRITGGVAAGRLLKAPKGWAVRPTPDLVKQAIFNSLGARVVGARVLELFAGTGALALECLSRGARMAVCVEKSRKHAEFIRANTAAIGLDASCLEIRVQDVFAAISQLVGAEQTFDLIFADPPYGEKNTGRRSNSYAQKLLDDEIVPCLLAEHGIFVLGHARWDSLEIPAQWTELRTLRHGDSVVRLLKRPTP